MSIGSSLRKQILKHYKFLNSNIFYNLAMITGCQWANRKSYANPIVLSKKNSEVHMTNEEANGLLLFSF